MQVIVFSHTHWDREWYKPFQDFRIRLCEVVDLLIEELINNTTEYFYLDGQTVILEDYLEIHPEKASLIKKLIEEKRLFIGPWYVLADEFLVSGESLIRNLLTGINQAKKYCCTDFFGYLPDSFGHNSKIPGILSSFGIKKAVLWRGAGNRKSEFIWESEDGSSILATYLIEGYFQDSLHGELPIDKKVKKIGEFLDRVKNRTISDKILLPVGGDHLGPVLNLNGLISELNKKLAGYEIKQGKIDDYFSSLNPPFAELETVKGELRDNSENPVLPGTLSSRLYLKQMNAGSTWLLSRIAEPLHSFLKTAGLVKSKKNELNYAWKLLLKNHPHDSICGCSVDEVHEENVSRFKQVNQISNAIIQRCICQISGMFSENELFVCNLSNYDYSGVVSVKTSGNLPMPHQFVKSSVEFSKKILLDTQRAPFCEDMAEFREYLVYTENVPSFSVKSILPVNCPDSVEVFTDKIANSSVEISINPDGSINLRDLKTAKAFEKLHIISDRADTGDNYNYAPLTGDKSIKAELISTEITEKGPLRGILKLIYRINIPKYFDFKGNSRSIECHETIISTEIIIFAGSKRAEFITSWENSCENHIMQLKFNLPQKITQTVSEDTFGLITRNFNPDYRMEDHIPAEKGKELKTNSAPMQRFVFTRGLGVITEGLFEYIVSGNSLAITILRATGKLSGISLNTRNFPAGPALDTPGAGCPGKHSVRYALCFAEDPQKLFREADEFMGSIIADTGRALTPKSPIFPGNLMNISGDNLLVYAVKNPENRKIMGIVVRMFNTCDESTETFFSSDMVFSGFIEVNSLEEPISKEYKMDDKITFGPKELKSLLFLKRR